MSTRRDEPPTENLCSNCGVRGGFVGMFCPPCVQVIEGVVACPTCGGEGIWVERGGPSPQTVGYTSVVGRRHNCPACNGSGLDGGTANNPKEQT